MVKGGRQKNKLGFPTVIAVRHPEVTDKYPDDGRLLKSSKALINFLERTSSDKRRTLYIELSQPQIDYYLKHGEAPGFVARFPDSYDPFFDAIDFAKKKGWNIVGLDKPKILLDLLPKQEQAYRSHSLLRLFEDIPPPPQLTLRYAMHNLREKSWAHKLKREKPTANDIVVMHPNHISGFLIESGLKGKNVVWIDKPRSLKIIKASRLNSREKRQLKRRRDQLREQRRKKIVARKSKPKVK